MQDVDDPLDQEEESEINLTPMLDVVFIMLIFFIVTAVFVREPGVEVTSPEAVTAADPGGGAIFVAITGENAIWIDQREIEPAGVRAAVERLRAQNPEAGVIIQSDNEADNSTLIAVMDAVKAAGINDITIAANDD